ncbi:MAG TPA: hypothetical protein VFE19_00270 [Jatrophihabitantaceae bacterium]|jgi:hypothetical protein|nr:hypothetical protein [Jatrophihabitantaceae bacterium]
MALKTSYEFTLPRGYLDDSGRLHKTGTMRLATARDELAPLRDPTVTGPDDPRLTILVLTRVVEKLGDLELVTSHDIEGLFAVDLAYLQDFYGVINFGSQDEYDALVNAQQSTPLLGDSPAAGPAAQPSGASGESAPAEPAGEERSNEQSSRPPLRTAVEELPRRAL